MYIYIYTHVYIYIYIYDPQYGNIYNVLQQSTYLMYITYFMFASLNALFWRSAKQRWAQSKQSPSIFPICCIVSSPSVLFLVMCLKLIENAR